MRILIDTAEEGLAAQLRKVLEDHDLSDERSKHIDVACLDGDPERVVSFAREHPQTSVIYIGSYAHLSTLLDAKIVDVIPADDALPARLRIAVARLAKGPRRKELTSGDDVVALFEQAADGVLVTTHEHVVYANNAFAQMLLDDPADLVGRSGCSFAHPEDAKDLREEEQECLASAKPSTLKVFRALRSDGSTLEVESLAVPLTFAGRASVLRFLRRRPESRELDDQMVLADRMASVGTLAAGAAHELNNPLAYVLTNLQMMRESIVSGASDLPSLVEQVDSAIQGAHRMADIVRDLKTFARQPSTATEVVDVTASLRSAIHMCENELRHRGRLTLLIEEIPTVEINASRLCQVFINLLINAAQAIEEVEDGEVRVSAGADERGWARIAISDNGPGIHAADMHRIFEPFFTTKAAIEGTGLGLSICRNLITQAQGELHVESAPGTGAKFTVYLPPSAAKAVAPRVSSKPPVGAHARILIIDDERLIGRAMERALGQHEVTVTTNGGEALQVLSESSFDLIFCDLMMPTLSGMDVYRQALERDPSLNDRFVFMTGGAFTAGARAFIADTECPVIEKPFNLKQVRTIAAEFVEQRRASKDEA